MDDRPGNRDAAKDSTAAAAAAAAATEDLATAASGTAAAAQEAGWIPLTTTQQQSGPAKKYEFTHSGPYSTTIRMNGEDHTLGAIVAEQLNAQRCNAAVAQGCDAGGEKFIEVRIEAPKGAQTAMEHALLAVEARMEEIRQIRAAVRAALDAQRRLKQQIDDSSNAN